MIYLQLAELSMDMYFKLVQIIIKRIELKIKCFIFETTKWVGKHSMYCFNVL